jgi:hypothetical protein
VKILLFCPTYTKPGGALAIHGRTQDSIQGLTIPDGVTVDVKISTNNPRPITGETKQDHENTLYQYRLARRMVLDGDYNALLTIEHDMIVPEDTLIKMLDTDADVVYGLYLFRHMTPVLNCLRAVKSDWVDMSITYFPEIAEQGYKQGWLECSGSGFGCTLMHRRVLEMIDFRRSDSGHPTPDMPFATDCLRNNYKQVCRFDVVCGHIKPDGTVLWPFENGGVMSKVKIYVYRSFNAVVGERSAHFEEGQVTEMPADIAGEFVRAGYIGIIDEPAVKVVRKPRAKPSKAVK